jgi:hypothetical protein
MPLAAHFSLHQPCPRLQFVRPPKKWIASPQPDSVSNDRFLRFYILYSNNFNLTHQNTEKIKQ